MKTHITREEAQDRYMLRCKNHILPTPDEITEKNKEIIRWYKSKGIRRNSYSVLSDFWEVDLKQSAFADFDNSENHIAGVKTKVLNERIINGHVLF